MDTYGFKLHHATSAIVKDILVPNTIENSFYNDHWRDDKEAYFNCVTSDSPVA